MCFRIEQLRKKISMSGNSVAEKTINQLKLKLETAISARSELEEDFSAQSSLLINFIGKLSQACKGIDIQLDNKLAALRVSLKKSTSFAELEQSISAVTVILQQHSIQNDLNVKKLHEKLQITGKNLQKLKDLPKDNRKKLRELVKTTQETKDSPTQYVPIMAEFLDFYQNAFNVQSALPSKGLLNNSPSTNKPDQEQDEVHGVSKKLLQRFAAILDNLMVSEKHKSQILKIKSTLQDTESNNALMKKCLTVFDLIIEDLKLERATAKVFLSTLTDTLATVQASVHTTLTATNESNDKFDKLNKELEEKIAEISIEVNDDNSLSDIKIDVNLKLQQLAETLAKKSKLEDEQRKILKNKLEQMSTQVDQLEQQSKSFEKRMQEQEIKNLQDALTKLCNRAAFDEHFSKEMERFQQAPFNLGIAVIDLDDFKRINDTYGHTAGDKTLQVIATTLTKLLGKDAFVGRYGGEEFVVVFSDQEKSTMINKLNMLRKKVAALPFTFKSVRVTITLSVGITLVENGDNIHSAFERADTALYQAKKDGKNRVLYG